MRRVIKLVVYLVVLAGIVVFGYAYLGDLSPKQSDVHTPVRLNVN